MTLHQSLLDAGAQLHVSCTGGGARLMQTLWERPGASSYLVGTTMPYGRAQMRSFLGFMPTGPAVSAEVALEMAMASYAQAAEQMLNERRAGQPLGLGLTAAVASEQLPRGEQRAFVALMTATDVRVLRVELARGVGETLRHKHDEELARAALELLTSVLGGCPLGTNAASWATELCFERPVFEADGTRSPASSRGLYLPATLNPLHEGHRAMLQMGEKACASQRPGRYLVTTSAVHKPTLRVQEGLERVAMVRAERWRGCARAVEFSRNDPLFIDKARQRPGSTFVIGADTLLRMLDGQWGFDSETVLNELRNAGAFFLVMGRKIDGRFVTCRDIAIPFPFALLFRPIEGRFDVSSTYLRHNQPAA